MNFPHAGAPIAPGKMANTKAASEHARSTRMITWSTAPPSVSGEIPRAVPRLPATMVPSPDDQ